MEWTADVAAGAWIRNSLDAGLDDGPADGANWGATMHGVVPRGFPAYARVFHPVHRSRPVHGAWPPLPYERHRREWEAFDHSTPIETESARWADAAAAFGTTMHPLAQWGALVRARKPEWDPSAWQQTQSDDGWQWDAPSEGQLDAASLARIAGHLVTATTTPAAGYAALWAGWGGLLGFFGETPARAFFSFLSSDGSDGPDDPATEAAMRDAADAALRDRDLHRHRAMLERSIHDPFNNVFRKPVWQPGILPDEVSNGARLDLPAREHVLFRGGVDELARPDWIEHVPWRDRAAEQHGFAPDAQSPSLIWPDDRAWVLVTEVDYDSTIVGGSPDLVAALCADPELEALPLPAGADLTYSGDRVNA